MNVIKWPLRGSLRVPYENLIIVFLLGLLSHVSYASPQINLFPSTVLEDIRHTGDVAKNMESSLQQLIGKLDQQQQLYQSSQCDGASDDQGCQQLAQQINQHYMQMLDVMANNLPEMEKAVNATRKNLERRIRNEVGHRMTAWDLQQGLLGQTAESQSTNQLQLRGQSGMKLSDRFNQYYQLVAHSSRHVDESLMVIAADIYLDMEDTAALIARTQDEIARASLVGKLNSAFGAITPEMQEVVNGVKGILFGDQQASRALVKSPVAASTAEFVSPFEL